MLDSLIRKTEKGKVQGINSNGVNKFLGIPFAKPPIGKRRFMPPEENDPWNGTYDATEFKNSPMQLSLNESEEYPPEDMTPMSEDCLYLNVYTPENTAEKNLPVMVWFYGGHYTEGTSMSSSCDGSNFSKNQNVIVVTFNYRLGIFGFMAHQSLKNSTKPATNAGVYDMLAALKWIHKNISYFGGDPNNVTLFGVSAGSSAINVLMTCPAANGLYHAVITQSGSPFNHDEWDVDEKQEQARCERYLKSVNITPEELLTAPTEKFLSNPEGYEEAQFCPYVDKTLIPDRLEQSFLKGNINDVPVIVGCTSDEAFILLGPEEKVTKEWFDETVHTKYPEDSDYIYYKYGPYLKQSPAYALGRFRSDNTIANMRYFATCLTKCRKSATYFYIFKHVTPGKNPYYFGAYHASENPYHFQNLDSKYVNYGNIDKKVSDTIAKYWATFAKNHIPGEKNMPKWNKFTRESDMVMYIDEPSECVPLQSKAITDKLQQLLARRTETNNPGLRV
ncbi:carboxylesterase family protein [Lactobacillus sp. ESL0791]|uniref:carboxylesterase/lipase family protein n=1 Tax=Lactobacillus sp. ESL0791 TaxID=2983234 RepID=UPI0023F7F3D1|nr:carboxylesterase family protein [Lactobacillus sp. ESL0791]MDF7639645.1 carboxylesterase family protein [Lactobacillus sp. ESL0791]